MDVANLTFIAAFVSLRLFVTDSVYDQTLYKGSVARDRFWVEKGTAASEESAVKEMTAFDRNSIGHPFRACCYFIRRCCMATRAWGHGMKVGQKHGSIS